MSQFREPGRRQAPTLSPYAVVTQRRVGQTTPVRDRGLPEIVRDREIAALSDGFSVTRVISTVPSV